MSRLATPCDHHWIEEYYFYHCELCGTIEFFDLAPAINEDESEVQE